MKKIITLLVAYLCLSVSTHAQTQDALITQQVTLHVATAGTLPDIIAPSRRPLITNLKLTGQLNGTDLRLIREMAGADVNGNPTQGALETIDLSEAEIVSGGEAYCVWTELSSPIRPGEEPQILWIRNYYTKEGLDALFSSCKNLKNVKLPNHSALGNVTSLYRAFSGCTNLTHVDIPESVTSLSSTFKGCTSLTRVDIPDSVTDLYYVFEGCTSLTNVDIPEGVTNLRGTFQGCTNLTHVDIPEGVTNLSSTFSGCTSLTHVDIPENVTDLQGTFQGCTSLTSVNFLGKSPLPLNEYGFKDTFKDCPNLQAIRFFSPAPLIPSIYPGISNDVIVYIPKGSYMSYWLTTWGDYNLVEFDATDIDTPIRTDKAGAREHYSIDGKRLTAPQHGLNIIREADGTTKKILIQ